VKRIGIYGGTFNPPHLGHVQVADYACKKLELQRLLIMPSCVPPHKELPKDSPTPRQRMEMLQLVFADRREITVSDMELRRGGVSYTIDTVKQVRDKEPEGELILLLGTDMFLSFENWYRWKEILQYVSLGVLYRGEGEEQLQIAKKKAELEKAGATVYLLENPIMPISSTQLRRMMTFQCEAQFLPPEIRSYIRENDLYGCRNDYRNLPMDKLEKVVVSLLKPNRVAHVLGCRDTARDLARKWGADETDAGRAGLLHDVTKALSGPLQLALCKAYGKNLSDFATQNPKTLHALTGSLVAQRIFGERPEVVSAICSHTTGKADMNLLEKIIYVADYMEPNRDFPGVDEMRHLAYTDIDEALKMGLSMTIDLLREQGRDVSPESARALAWLQNSK